MRFIYFCWGSAHSSITAAAVHLGNLPSDRTPSIEEITGCPRFDLTPNGEIGTLFFMGHDEKGHDVYVLGLGAQHKRFKYLIDRYLQELGMDKAAYRLINCLPCVNWPTRIGGFSSRSLGAIRMGRPLAAWGVARSYYNYVRLVQKAKASVAQEPSFLDWAPPL